MAVDEERLAGFVRRLVDDLAATMAAGGVVIGDRLGLYRALAERPLRPQELAERTGTVPRYVEEWLRGQAAGHYVEYDPATGRYHLTEEQAHALTHPDGPLHLPAAFQLALGALRAEPEISAAFQTGAGLDRRRHDADVLAGSERFFRPASCTNLVQEWLPALPDVVDKLTAGVRVADVGCGRGSATALMALAFPRSTFIGYDDHAASIEAARTRTAAPNLSYQEASAHSFPGGPYELVTSINALHGLGDPLGAARQVCEQLAPDGTWLIVEPTAGPSVSENLTPVGRFYYALSMFLSVPNALAQDGGYSLGAQAGEGPIRRLVGDAGFGRFRRVTQTPFSLVYEARP